MDALLLAYQVVQRLLLGRLGPDTREELEALRLTLGRLLTGATADADL